MPISINLQHKAMISTAILFIMLVGLTISYCVLQWHNDWLLTHQKLTPKAITTTDETGTLINDIPNVHLFGEAVTKLGEVPTSNLQLSVTGIVKAIASKTGQVSKAYISISGQPSKIYRVGDILPYGVKIYDITSNTVILENNGNFEKVSLQRESLQFKKHMKEELSDA